ncbi:MAG TPA: TetR/AcrR family transcriptional regulator [Acidimicrobiales bacterium]|nr:TetR/AcrR family transcriptional regulator [Acidimicrobiales bacterium]
MPRPKQRTTALRDRVLEVALLVLAEEGVAGVTTRKVAKEAETSPPAVYELFGDKAGLVREMFYEGFRVLHRYLDRQGESEDPIDDLKRLFYGFRSFACENPVLAGLMFSRPFAEFDPGPTENEAGATLRELIVGRVCRCKDAGAFHGNPTDAAHVCLALAQGLAAQETAGWLGTSRASRKRRWDLAVDSLVNGMMPGRTK